MEVNPRGEVDNLCKTPQRSSSDGPETLEGGLWGLEDGDLNDQRLGHTGLTRTSNVEVGRENRGVGTIREGESRFTQLYGSQGLVTQSAKRGRRQRK